MKQVFVRRGRINLGEVPGPGATRPGFVSVALSFSFISVGSELAGVQSTKASSLAKKARELERLRKLRDLALAKGFAGVRALIAGCLAQYVQLGYSCSGTVLEVGEGVTDLAPGDRVACAGQGHALHAGIVTVPRNLVVPVPDGCGIDAAASVAVGAIALQAVRRCSPAIGESIAVVGLGLIGRLTSDLLRANSCVVVGIEPDAKRLREADGLHRRIDPGTHELPMAALEASAGQGVDATIITAGGKATGLVQMATEITRLGGRIVVVGDVDLSFGRDPFYRKEQSILMSRSYGPGRYDESYEQMGRDYPFGYVRWTENRNMQAFLGLLSCGMVPFESYGVATYSVTEAESAYRSLESPERPLGVLLRFEEEDRRPVKSVAVTSRPPARDAGPPVGLALVGAGGFARTTHLPNLERLRQLTKLVWLVDSVAATAKTTAERYACKSYSSTMEEMLVDPRVHAVLITTRHNTHASLARQCLASGKSVFVEKPLAVSLDGLNELCETAEASPGLLQVGFNRRFSPFILKARDLVLARSAPLVVCYRVNAGHIPYEHWVHQKEGGGRLVGEACHMLDTMRSLIGCPAVSATVTGARSRQSGMLQPEDNFAVTVSYADGSLGNLVYTSAGPADTGKERIEVYWEGSSLVIDDFRTFEFHSGRKRQSWHHRVPDKGHFTELETFLRAIANGDEQPIPLAEMRETTELTLQLRDELSAAPTGFGPCETADAF